MDRNLSEMICNPPRAGGNLIVIDRLVRSSLHWSFDGCVTVLCARINDILHIIIVANHSV